MSRRTTRPWVPFFLASVIALSACSTSDTSGIRIRNSASIETCLKATLKAVRVEITRNSCAAAIVEVSRVRYPNDVTTPGPRSRSADVRVAEVLAIGIDHLGQPFDFAFEARNAANEPIEHVRVQGVGADPSQFVVSYSTITPISDTDSCIQVVANSSGLNLNGLCGASTENYYARAIVDRSNDFAFHFYQTYISPNRETIFSPFPSRDTPTAEQYWSLISHNNGTPTHKMAISRIGTSDFVIKHYSYSQPTTIQPYQVDVVAAATPTTTVSTTTTIDGVSTTVQTNTTTTQEDSTATSTTASSPSSTIGSSTPAVSSISTRALLRSIDTICTSVDGIEFSSDPQNWTDATRFEITVQNDCMQVAAELKTRFPSASLQQLIKIINSDTQQEVYFYGLPFFSNSDAVLKNFFTGRLPAGEWEMEIRQVFSMEQVSQLGPPKTIVARKTISLDVSADASQGWDRCTSNDVRWNGTDLSLDCEYSFASAGYINANSEYQGFEFLTGASGKLPQLRNGWTLINLEVYTDNFLDQFAVLVCANECNQLPAATDVSIEISSQEEGDFKRTALTIGSLVCAPPTDTSVNLIFMKKLYDKLFVKTASASQKGLFDIEISSEDTSIVDIPLGNTHVLVLQSAMRSTDECLLGMNFQNYATLVEVPQKATSNNELPEPVVNALPAPIDNIEFSLVNAQGSPIILEKNQSEIAISLTDLNPNVFSPDSGVLSVEISDNNGQWLPIDRALFTSIPISTQTSQLQVKYTFADGTESIITKPIISADAYQLALDINQKSTSNNLGIILLILAVLVVVSGGALTVRRRKA